MLAPSMLNSAFFRSVLLVSSTTWAAAAGAITTVDQLAPPAGAQLPLNAKIWIHALSGDGPVLDVTFTQGDVSTAMITKPGVCCFSYQASIDTLAVGALELTIDPPDGDAVTANYTVVDAVDEVPPSIGRPVLVARRRGAFDSITSVTVLPADLDDDWGVVAVIPEFNTRRDAFAPAGAPPQEDDWEAQRIMIGEPGFAEGETEGGFSSNDPRDICARLIAVDVGGNQTVSEVACLDDDDPDGGGDVLAPFRALAGSLGADCACTHVDDEAPSALAMLLVILFARRRSATSKVVERT